MNMEKLKSLELKKLILEIELIEMDENYTKEFVSNYRPKFNKHLRDISPEFFQKTNQSEATPPPPDNTESEESEVNKISESEKAKIKKIYKEISKLCHPDKSNDKTYNELYVEAKFAYEKNDLMSLIKISNKLLLEFSLDEEDLGLLKRDLEKRKTNLVKIEGTFLWLWVNAETEEEKEKIIKMYIQQHS